MSGWIKLHRSLLDWEWYDDANATRLLIHLLVSVNYEEKQWKGVKIMPGQIIFSWQTLSRATGLTLQQLRTAINKLENSREINREVTANYQLVTLVKWDKLQGDNSEVTAKKQQKQQPANRTATTTKEGKEIKENINDQFEIFWNKYPNKTGKKPAKEKFANLTDSEIQIILNTIDSFAAYKPFETYSHPHATTYLNQRRWEDVIPVPEKKEHNITQDVWHIAKQIPAQKAKLCAQFNLTAEQFDNLYK